MAPLDHKALPAPLEQRVRLAAQGQLALRVLQVPLVLPDLLALSVPLDLPDPLAPQVLPDPLDQLALLARLALLVPRALLVLPDQPVPRERQAQQALRARQARLVQKATQAQPVPLARLEPRDPLALKARQDRQVSFTRSTSSMAPAPSPTIWRPAARSPPRTL